MLKPFQIRNLLDFSLNPGLLSSNKGDGLEPKVVNRRADGSITPPISRLEAGLGANLIYRRANGSIFPFSRDGTVQVSADEYDETISSHPQSKLSYMDNDDGELIIVSRKINQNS